MASLIRRNGTFYLQWRVGRTIRRRSLQTKTRQIAKEKLRAFESARLRGIDNPLPTKTPLPDILQAYVEHIRAIKTPKSAQTDVYYLREAFGSVCQGLEITSRRVTEACRKRPVATRKGRRARVATIDARCLEDVTTADVATFITTHTRRRGLAPKTANRYREILVRLFNWAISQEGVRMPGGVNPAAGVERYRERAPEIRYLTLTQIDEQLAALAQHPQLQTMVAVLIYAGLRREELLWLTRGDVSLPQGQPGLIHVRAKTVVGVSWQPKTKRNRSVPISRDLRAYLDTYAPRPARGDWFFPSPKGEHYDPDNFSRDLRAANDQAGLPWACLDYRHTFGSHLAQRGVSLYQTSALMGNSPEICRRHYAALLPTSMHGCVEFAASATTCQQRAI